MCLHISISQKKFGPIVLEKIINRLFNKKNNIYPILFKKSFKQYCKKHDSLLLCRHKKPENGLMIISCIEHNQEQQTKNPSFQVANRAIDTYITVQYTNSLKNFATTKLFLRFSRGLCILFALLLGYYPPKSKYLRKIYEEDNQSW